MKYGLFCLLVLLASSTAILDASAADQAFFGKAGYYDVELSPDGKYIAVVLDKDDQRVAGVLESDTLKLTSFLSIADDRNVNWVEWASNKRLVAGLMRPSLSWGDGEYRTSDLIAVDYDGRNAQNIYGPRAEYESITGTGSDSVVMASYKVVDYLKDDPDWILVADYPWKLQGHWWTYRGDMPTVTKLNIKNGRRALTMRTPVRYGEIVTDRQGNVRIADGSDKESNAVTYLRKDGEWEELRYPGKPYGDFSPVFFSEDGKSLYSKFSRDNGPRGLYLWHLESGDLEELYTPAQANVDSVIWAGTDRQMLYARSRLGPAEFHYLNPGSREAAVHKALVRAFAGQNVSIRSATDDFSLLAILVDSDTNPGDFYLFDTKKMGAQYLFSRHEAIDTEKLSPTETLSIPLDGDLQMSAYLTVPGSAGDKPMPLVVIPHGGPHGPRDYWKYDAEAQYLAARGYAVLKMNFRGSGGFGKAYRRAGYGKWGTLIQSDINTATRWVLQNRKIDPERVCIFGASFGGYSAMMAPIRAPGLYACAAGYAGVYDLGLMYEVGDIPSWYRGKSYLEDAIGTDPAVHKANSPVHQADKLDLPIFLAHGGRDVRVPIEHVDRLRAALDKAGKEYKYRKFSREHHGLSNEKIKNEFYSELADFFDDHIGK